MYRNYKQKYLAKYKRNCIEQIPFYLSSHDDWTTATEIASTQTKDMFSFPSTATLNNTRTVRFHVGFF